MPSEEGEGGGNDEMESAQTSLNEYETKGRMQGQSLWQRLFEVRKIHICFALFMEVRPEQAASIFSSLLLRQQGFSCALAQIWGFS